LKKSSWRLKLFLPNIVFSITVEKNINNESSLNDPKLGSTSFEVPKGYFEALPSAISDKIAVSPLAESISRPLPFRAPDGYFEQLSLSVQRRISPEGPVRRLFKPVLALSLAAVITGVFFLFRAGDSAHPVPFAMEPLTVAELEDSYLLFDLDEDVLSAAYSAQIAAAADDNEELEDYLIDNESDFSQINIEL